jgi:hypothetical protein
MSIGCYHHLPRATQQSYKFISPVYKTQTVACQVGDSRALSFFEKEAMAPRTVGGLYHRTIQIIRAQVQKKSSK